MSATLGSRFSAQVGSEGEVTGEREHCQSEWEGYCGSDHRQGTDALTPSEMIENTEEPDLFVIAYRKCHRDPEAQADPAEAELLRPGRPALLAGSCT